MERTYSVSKIEVDLGDKLDPIEGGNWYELVHPKRARVHCHVRDEISESKFKLIVDFRGPFCIIDANNCHITGKEVLIALSMELALLTGRGESLRPHPRDMERRVITCSISNSIDVIHCLHHLKERGGFRFRSNAQ